MHDNRGNAQDAALIASNIEEMKELKLRFDLLSKQYQDVQTYCRYEYVYRNTSLSFNSTASSVNSFQERRCTRSCGQ